MNFYILLLTGTLTLVDLAGSERMDQNAVAATRQETKNINLSLLELGNVLRSLRKKVIFSICVAQK